MECKFCKRTGERTFNLYSQYGNAPNSIRDDLVELFGLEIESDLNEMEDYVCNVCMNMLDNMTKMRRHMLNILKSPRESKNTMKFGRFWDAVASYKFDECDFDGDLITPTRTPTPLPKSQTPTPSSFVTRKISREFDDALGEAAAQRDWHRSQSRLSTRSHEKSDGEVEIYFNKAKRKKLRGHNWSGRRSRRRREGAYSAGPARQMPKSRHLRSVQSEGQRLCSPVSDCSYVSYIKTKKDWTPKPIVLEYDRNGELLRRRTRSVNQMEKLEEEKKNRENCKIYQCKDDNDCSVYMEDLDLFTQHRISEHGILALYPCSECSATYTTESHLKIHEKCHDWAPHLCLMCGCLIGNFMDLQKHLGDHLDYSTPCAYCDFSFTSKQILEKHVKTSHLGKKRRIYHRPKPCILKRIDSDITKDQKALQGSKEESYEGRIYILTLKKQHSASDVSERCERFSEVHNLVDEKSVLELNESNNTELNYDCRESDNSDCFENNVHTAVNLDDSNSEFS